jgi:glycosyltransferase involved in cell wall biosynthesis
LGFAAPWVRGKIGEGFPVAILEAGAAGKPVVTTRTCGAEEIIEDGVTGRLVPLGNAKALAEAIDELLENRERAHRMAENPAQGVKRVYLGAGLPSL